MKNDSLLLLVEDCDEDYEIAIRAFQKVYLEKNVFRCEDGDKALNYLFREGEFLNPESSPRPQLILLDLNLPGIDGRTVLTKIKNDHRLKRIPVVVLTTSANEHDIDRCYEIGANSFMQKPVSFERFVEAMRKLKEYWFESVLFSEVK